MDTVTIPVKEYKRLLNADEGKSSRREKKERFTDAAFGILREGFGKESSILYVSKLRKA